MGEEGRDMSIEEPISVVRHADASAPAWSGEPRRSPRTLTVFRTVKVQVGDTEGLARLQNISDEGMKLTLKLPISPDDVVTIFLSDADRLEGRVVWTDGNSCGLQLTEPVDSAALLSDLAASARDGSTRAVRMKADAAAVAYSEGGVHRVRLEDISQRGMKVRHTAKFDEGLAIKVRLLTGLELRGIVRWSQEDVAGIELLELISVEQLGSSRDL
jgi:translation initiation factor IF-1